MGSEHGRACLKLGWELRRKGVPGEGVRLKEADTSGKGEG